MKTKWSSVTIIIDIHFEIHNIQHPKARVNPPSQKKSKKKKIGAYFRKFTILIDRNHLMQSIYDWQKKKGFFKQRKCVAFNCILL